MHGRGDGRRRAPPLPDLRRRGPPLRPRPRHGPRTRLLLRVRRRARRGEGLARARVGLPALGHKDHGLGRGARPRVRLLPGRRPARAALHPGARHRQARRRGRPEVRARRPLRPRPRDDGQPQGGLARRPADARRPDLRGRALPGYHGVYPLPPRPRAPARGGGLRGVHAPLPGRLGPPDHALAPLDRPLGHDLRRPRRPRRLEHLKGVGGADARQALVGGAHRRRVLVVLDLPAPRQPLPGGARGRRHVRPGPASADDATRVLREFAYNADRQVEGTPLELPPRLRQGAPDRGRLPRRPGAHAGQALDAGRQGVGVAPREGHRRLRPPPLRHLDAVPALPGLPPPRGGERGDLRRRPRAARPRGSASSCASSWTSSTGPPSTPPSPT